MTIAEWLRHPFHRGMKRGPGAEPRDVHEFIAERREGMEHVSLADVDAMTADALSRVDRDETLREIDELRAKVHAQPGDIARNSLQ